MIELIQEFQLHVDVNNNAMITYLFWKEDQDEIRQIIRQIVIKYQEKLVDVPVPVPVDVPVPVPVIVDVPKVEGIEPLEFMTLLLKDKMILVTKYNLTNNVKNNPLIMFREDERVKIRDFIKRLWQC